MAELPAHEPGPHEVFDQHEQQRQVAYAINNLPEHERMVTALFYLGGLLDGRDCPIFGSAADDGEEAIV